MSRGLGDVYKRQTKLISDAAKAAGKLIAQDPELVLPENRLLGAYISDMIQSSLHTIS